MALLHQADLRPSKMEILAGWVPSRPWFDGDPESVLVNVAAYRFDDPEGDVGIETFFVRAGGGPLLQVPVTYRNAPLDGAEASFVGTMEHSDLGTRYAYDGAGDPAYLAAVATAALVGGHEAELFVDIEGERVQRQPNARIAGSGSTGSRGVALPDATTLKIRDDPQSTSVETGDFEVVIARRPDGLALETASVTATLSGSWTDHPAEAVLVTVTVR